MNPSAARDPRAYDSNSLAILGFFRFFLFESGHRTLSAPGQAEPADGLIDHDIPRSCLAEIFGPERLRLFV